MASFYSWFGKWWGRFWRGVGVLFEEYKFARRFLFFWAVLIVTDTHLWYKSLPNPTDNHRLYALAIIGLMSLMIAFYQWSREKEDKLEKANA